MWFVKPDEASKSSVLERQLERVERVRGVGGDCVCVSRDDRHFEWGTP